MLDLAVRSVVSAAGSRDPDGHELTYHWWVYPEAGTYRGKPTLDDSNSPQVNVTLPPDATGEVHVILEVTDNGPTIVDQLSAGRHPRELTEHCSPTTYKDFPMPSVYYRADRVR